MGYDYPPPAGDMIWNEIRDGNLDGMMLPSAIAEELPDLFFPLMSNARTASRPASRPASSRPLCPASSRPASRSPSRPGSAATTCSYHTYPDAQSKLHRNVSPTACRAARVRAKRTRAEEVERARAWEDVFAHPCSHLISPRPPAEERPAFPTGFRSTRWVGMR